MPSTYTQRLRAERPQTGEQAGVWGETVNFNITDLVDESISSVVNIAVPDSDLALTIPNGASSPHRAFAMVFTGSLSTTRTMIVPDIDRRFEVTNRTNQWLNFKNSTVSQVGVMPGETAVIYSVGLVLSKVLQIDPVSADTQPVSPRVNQLWFDGSRGILFIYFWDGNTAQWVQTVPTTTGISVADAAAIYLPLAGGTMTGALNLSGPPSVDLGAATKKYVDEAVASGGGVTYTKVQADTKFVDVAGDTMTGALVVPLGTAAAPSVSFTGETNTGIYRSAANVLSIATAGVQRLSIDSYFTFYGNQYVNTPAPSLVLDGPASSNKTIIGRANSVVQWTMWMGEGGAGDFKLNRTDNTPAEFPSLNITRVSGEWGINGVPQSGTALNVTTLTTSVTGRGVTLANASAGTSANVDIRFNTGAVSRARIRGEREVATSNGKLVFSTFVSTTETDAMTIGSDRVPVFNIDKIRIATAKTPASAIAAGVVGDVCWDAVFLYVCVAANSWKRAAIAAW